MNIHPSIAALLDEVGAFRTLKGLSASAFGRVAVNDPNFVGDLLNGRLPSLAMIDRVRDFMRSQEADAA